MVELRPPPPTRGVTPVLWVVPKGATLVRIFDPARWHATALTFRVNGPRKRFDHQRGAGPLREPCDDPQRAVYYAAWSEHLPEALSSCLVEIFGDSGIVEMGDLCVASPVLARPARLLDLRGRGALRAGTVAAVAKCEYTRSQPWSRHFYEQTGDYGALDGLLYRNAHNDEPAVLLYERAQDSLRCSTATVVRLDHPALRPQLLDIMRQNNLTF